MDRMISVVIPVGPHQIYRKWLPEAIHSVLVQDFQGEIEIVLIDDYAHVSQQEFYDLVKTVDSEAIVLENNAFSTNRTIRLYQTWWNVGVADAFNFGVALSENELVFMLGSDDKLMPECLSECHKAWQKNGQRDAWYSVTIQYESGALQAIPCNAAMVTKNLWKWTGGFPPSAGVGACDAIVLSILMKHAPDKIVKVKEGTPLCWLREHEHQDTKKNAWFYNPEIISIRNKETERFVPKKIEG